MDTSVIEYAPRVREVYGVPERVEWNGNVEDRQAALTQLDAVIRQGGVFASVWTGERTAEHVRGVAEVEELERQLGHVEVTVTPQVRGG